MKSIYLLLVLLSLPLIAACAPTLDVTAEEVEHRINEELKAGDGADEIEAYFKNEGLSVSYDEFNSRYQSIIRHPESNYHAITIYIYVDKDGNFVKAEANDSYTSL